MERNETKSVGTSDCRKGSPNGRGWRLRQPALLSVKQSFVLCNAFSGRRGAVPYRMRANRDPPLRAIISFRYPLHKGAYGPLSPHSRSSPGVRAFDFTFCISFFIQVSQFLSAKLCKYTIRGITPLHPWQIVVKLRCQKGVVHRPSG